jgi:group II intron reverse transcriptase/maturase
MVLHCEETKWWRTDGRKSEFSNSTDEAGELASERTPQRKGESRNAEPPEGKMTDIPRSENVSTKQRRIAEVARHMSGKALTSLSHHIDLDWMYEAYRRVKKDGASGVDGQTAKEFEKDLEGNLQSLLTSAKDGTYRAPAVRRTYIPKGDGLEKRPIGIPTLADKVVQKAIVMAVEPIYEQDFMNCSYGFRPNRSAHQALEEVRNGMMKTWGGWVVELDIRKYFDTIDHNNLRKMLRKRIRDGVVLRLIDKWLNAGVMEEGMVYYPEAGTPQGGIVSPILANIYLHDVLDMWFEHEVKPRLRGEGFLVRYADDAVMGFSDKGDAHRVLEVLPKRFAKYVLGLHPEKTRLVPFQRPTGVNKDRNNGAESFDFLGFTHYWGKSRKGKWVVKQKTAKDRLTRAIKKISLWCRKVRHWKVREQHKKLVVKMRGHYGYYGITGNVRALACFREEVTRVWKKWLCRRSQKRKGWDMFTKILKRYPLPPPRIVHSYIK